MRQFKSGAGPSSFSRAAPTVLYAHFNFNFRLRLAALPRRLLHLQPQGIEFAQVEGRGVDHLLHLGEGIGQQ